MSSGTGDPKRALDLYDQTVQIVTTNDPEAPIPNYLIGNRANSLYLIGRYDESIGAYKLCIQQSVGLGQANCLLGIASVYRDLGDVAMARDFLTKAAAVIEAKAPPGSGMSFALAIVRGKLALSERHFGDARTALATVIDRVKTTAHAVGALTVRAEVNLEDDQLAAAEADARAALSLSEKLQGGKPYSNRTGLAWFVLARTLEKQGNTIEASKAVQSAVLHLTNTVDSNHPALIGAKKLSESLAHESKAES
jgi:tetratricopeptide (TPR) repeat protein